jgi:hypothetical protein
MCISKDCPWTIVSHRWFGVVAQMVLVWFGATCHAGEWSWPCACTDERNETTDASAARATASFARRAVSTAAWWAVTCARSSRPASDLGGSFAATSHRRSIARPHARVQGPDWWRRGEHLRLQPLKRRREFRRRSGCPGRNPPFSAVKRPTHPYKRSIQNRFTAENAKGA